MSAQEDYLRGIADAIRAQDGTGEPIKGTDFAKRIRAITGDAGSFSATEGDYQRQRLTEVAEAIRAAEGSGGEIPAGTFAERIRAIETGDRITRFFNNARAALDRMSLDESYTTDDGMRELFFTALGPWLFLRVPTTELASPNISDIWNGAYGDFGGELFYEAGISLSLEDVQLTGVDSFTVVYTMNGTTFTTEVSPQVPGAVITGTINASIDAWIGGFQTNLDRAEAFETIRKHADENFVVLEQMMRDIFAF